MTAESMNNESSAQQTTNPFLAGGERVGSSGPRTTSSDWIDEFKGQPLDDFTAIPPNKLFEREASATVTDLLERHFTSSEPEKNVGSPCRPRRVFHSGLDRLGFHPSPLDPSDQSSLSKPSNRVSSCDWVRDYKDDYDPKENVSPQNVFGTDVAGTIPPSDTPGPRPGGVDDSSVSQPGAVPVALVSGDVVSEGSGSQPGAVVSDDEESLPATESAQEGCQPTDLDVLFGRGGRGNHHLGNKRYRQMVLDLKPQYRESSKAAKTEISISVVDCVYGYGGRFLVLDESTKAWREADKKVARRKVSQALREEDRKGRKENDRKARTGDQRKGRRENRKGPSRTQAPQVQEPRADVFAIGASDWNTEALEEVPV